VDDWTVQLLVLSEEEKEDAAVVTVGCCETLEEIKTDVMDFYGNEVLEEILASCVKLAIPHLMPYVVYDVLYDVAKNQLLETHEKGKELKKKKKDTHAEYKKYEKLFDESMGIQNTEEYEHILASENTARGELEKLRRLGEETCPKLEATILEYETMRSIPVEQRDSPWDNKPGALENALRSKQQELLRKAQEMQLLEAAKAEHERTLTEASQEKKKCTSKWLFSQWCAFLKHSPGEAKVYEWLLCSVAGRIAKSVECGQKHLRDVDESHRGVIIAALKHLFAVASRELVNTQACNFITSGEFDEAGVNILLNIFDE